MDNELVQFTHKYGDTAYKMNPKMSQRIIEIARATPIDIMGKQGRKSILIPLNVQVCRGIKTGIDLFPNGEYSGYSIPQLRGRRIQEDDEWEQFEGYKLNDEVYLSPMHDGKGIYISAHLTAQTRKIKDRTPYTYKRTFRLYGVPPSNFFDFGARYEHVALGEELDSLEKEISDSGKIVSQFLEEGVEIPYGYSDKYNSLIVQRDGLKKKIRDLSISR
ncbi:MAG: hypothetical protein KC506_01340 [Nanoarchaeota archaeon]|nr:hypothetical protein [Nanoarchaeota archaeon]